MSEESLDNYIDPMTDLDSMPEPKTTPAPFSDLWDTPVIYSVTIQRLLGGTLSVVVTLLLRDLFDHWGLVSSHVCFQNSIDVQKLCKYLYQTMLVHVCRADKSHMPLTI